MLNSLWMILFKVLIVSTDCNQILLKITQIKKKRFSDKNFRTLKENETKIFISFEH